jgi:hypothetical protein
VGFGMGAIDIGSTISARARAAGVRVVEIELGGLAVGDLHADIWCRRGFARRSAEPASRHDDSRLSIEVCVRNGKLGTRRVV